jgi:Surfeit locus protein 6
VKSAKDVMDELAKKRKLEQFEDDSEIEGVQKELPKQGLKIADEKKAKKQKTATNSEAAQTQKERQKADSSKDTLNPEKKLSKQEKKRAKLLEKEAKKATAAAHTVTLPADNDVENEATSGEAVANVETTNDQEASEEEHHGNEIETFDAEGLEEQPDAEKSPASPSSIPPSPTFDHATAPSANTSTSSTIPPATAPKHIKLPTNPELLKARLTARIEALRTARKADGPDGKPARNRQELMEQRRKKELQRRAHRKELREKAKIEDDARREAALASARDSPASSMLSPLIRSPDNNFSFGRVAFADGQTLTGDLSSLREVPKKKGPQDAATALLASEKKRLRIAGLDDEKRADIEEKDLWLNAKKRAHGEKIRDDASLLKKTLKRKEKAKKKSEKEWGERKDGVAKGQAMRQKKREENLRKRRDEKGSKGKGKSKGKPAGGSKGKKPKSRPGFEGSFGSRA